MGFHGWRWDFEQDKSLCWAGLYLSLSIWSEWRPHLPSARYMQQFVAQEQPNGSANLPSTENSTTQPTSLWVPATAVILSTARMDFQSCTQKESVALSVLLHNTSRATLKDRCIARKSMRSANKHLKEKTSESSVLLRLIRFQMLRDRYIYMCFMWDGEKISSFLSELLLKNYEEVEIYAGWKTGSNRWRARWGRRKGCTTNSGAKIREKEESKLMAANYWIIVGRLDCICTHGAWFWQIAICSNCICVGLCIRAFTHYHAFSLLSLLTA